MNRQAEKEQGSSPLNRKRDGIPKLLDDTVTSTYHDVLAIVEAKFELLKIEMTEKIAVVAALSMLGVILIIGRNYAGCNNRRGKRNDH